MDSRGHLKGHWGHRMTVIEKSRERIWKVYSQIFFSILKITCSNLFSTKVFSLWIIGNDDFIDILIFQPSPWILNNISCHTYLLSQWDHEGLWLDVEANEYPETEFNIYKCSIEFVAELSLRCCQKQTAQIERLDANKVFP